MKRFALLLLAFAVVSSGAAYGNAFFKDYLGVWREKGKHTYSANGGITWFSEATVRVTKLRKGGFYLYTTGKVQGKRSVTKVWLYPDNTYEGESSLDGEIGDKGNGRWRIDRKGRLIMNATFNGRFGKVDGVIRRINKNKFVSTVKGPTATSYITLTRIRK